MATTESGGERRRFPRVRAPEGAYASYVEGAGKIVDLSLGGVKIRDQEPVYEGTRFDMRMHLEGEVLESKAVVLRAVPGRGMVVKFTDLSPDAKQNLHRYMAKLHLESRKPRD